MAVTRHGYPYRQPFKFEQRPNKNSDFSFKQAQNTDWSAARLPATGFIRLLFRLKRIPLGSIHWNDEASSLLCQQNHPRQQKRYLR